MTTNSAELKPLPCPFCGGHAKLENGPPELWYVECSECGIDGKIAHSAKDAAAAWNRRSAAHGEQSKEGEQTAPEGWKPIETAPKDGTPILLGRAESEFHTAESTVGWWQEAEEDGVDYMGGDAGFVDFAFQVFNPGRSFGNPNRMYAADQPTHWLPLPAAPSTAQKHGGRE